MYLCMHVCVCMYVCVYVCWLINQLPQLDVTNVGGLLPTAAGKGGRRPQRARRATLHQGARKPKLRFNAPRAGHEEAQGKRRSAQAPKHRAKEFPCGVEGEQPPSTPWSGQAVAVNTEAALHRRGAPSDERRPLPPVRLASAQSPPHQGGARPPGRAEPP